MWISEWEWESVRGGWDASKSESQWGWGWDVSVWERVRVNEDKVREAVELREKWVLD